MDEFTVYLLSNNSTTHFPSNCSNSFTVKLNKSISFQNHADWELAMTEIIYPSTICSLNGERLIILKNNVQHKVIHYPSVQCVSLQELVHQLNGSNSEYYKFSLEHQRVLKLTVRAPYTVVLDQALSDILCLDYTVVPHHVSPIWSGDTPSLTRNVDYLYVYTNIGQYVLVGDVQVPLLRYFPFNSSTASMKSKVFAKRLYVGLSQSYIEHIEVSIRDGAGELVPFFGHTPTQLTLHFRQRH